MNYKALKGLFYLVMKMVNRFDDWLSHHGIKGMRWGIRRTAEELGHITEKSANVVSSVSNMKRRKRGGINPKAKSMTDEELRKEVNRLNLEKQYSDLTRKDTVKGFDTVKDILAIVGSTAAIAVAGVNLYSSLRYGENPNDNGGNKK